LDGLISSFGEFLADPGNKFRREGLAKSVTLTKSVVRLNDPDGYKYGGGHRVKSVKLKDNWKAMTNQYDSEYGQEYNYETTEIFNGQERRISSGVASYEPSIGGEENPFQTIVQVANKLPLGPTSFGAIEMPVLDAFFPAPLVGYSTVTVRSLKRTEIPADKKSRSGIGKQVTEYYTAKDFPVYTNHTSFDTPSSEKEEHKSSLLAFFYKYAFDSRALSQGFIVETNDMHGKVKSQASYGEADTLTRINYSENFYRNTGYKGLNEKFDFIDTAKGGRIVPGNMGIDVELMTDTREFSVKSTSLEIQGQLDLFPVFGVFPWLPFIWGVSGNSENTYRAVTTTKVINYHSILDSVVVIDKGSQVSTKNLVYDAETGSVVINRTNNEFDQTVYSINYPAYWAYSGMGLAYKNIDAVYSGIKFRDGKITEGISAADIKKIFESGDELFLINTGTAPTDDCGSKLPNYTDTLLWVFDKNKNTSSLTNTAPDIVFMNKSGQLSNRDGVSFRIVRSGKRNMLSASLASVTSMNNPIATVAGIPKLVINNTIVANSANKVINATAVEYKEKWQTDNDVIKKLKLVFDPNTCTIQEVVDCDGYLEKSINPYRKGLLGNFRINQSKVFYGNRADTITVATILKQNGYLKNFALYWNFNTSNNLIPNLTNTTWVWNSQITKFNSKGLELETKDALSIYTAAQYGYNKTVPVAIANNSRYDEMFYEGFEDKDYQEGLNVNVLNNCAKKHVEFKNIPFTQIVNTDTLSLNAHSGKYALAITEGKTASKTFSIAGILDDFQFVSKKDTATALNQPGVNLESTEMISPGVSFYQYFGTAVDLQLSDTITYNINQQGPAPTDPPKETPYEANGSMNYKSNFSFYVNVAQFNTYDIYTTLTSDAEHSVGTITFKMDFQIFDVEGNLIANSEGFNAVLQPAPATGYKVCLPKGIYKIVCKIEHRQGVVGEVRHDNRFHASINDLVQFKLINSSAGYKSLSKQITCIFTKPIAATDSMLNPIFNIPNKKMYFSAWVKENCDNRTTQTNCKSKVILQYNGGSSQVDEPTLAGPII
ncbi:MAG TPA: hypothetical protein VJU78_17770, partial [Chitinophagaceae bacterium]|nr:hypothetical protein [Chitinophagaceae bacterium]